MVVYIYNSITWDVEAGGSRVQGCSWLDSKLEASPGYNKLCPTNKQTNKICISIQIGASYFILFHESNSATKSLNKHRILVE